MKKTLLAVIAILVIIPFISQAQTNTFPSSGNVGIGTTIPPNKLTIYDNATGSNVFRIIKEGYYDELALYNFSNTDYYRIDVGFRRGRGTAGSPAATQNGDWLGGVNFWAANSGAGFSNPSATIIGEVDGTPGASYVPGKIVFQTSDGTATTVDRMTIKNNGNVGIGTTSPSAKLDVANNISIGAQGGTDITTISGGAGYGSVLKMYYADGVENIRLAGNNDSYLNVNHGNVGIGTTDTKGYKFAVNGTAVATAMTVKLYGSWPDYVFKPAYKLPSLASVKAYIGEMVKLQTKKIEELTLYLLKENEAKQAQQKEINELRRQVETLLKKKS
jgi:hypothetical protein